MSILIESQAIDSPGFNTAHFPNSFYPRETDLGAYSLENRFPEGTLKNLIKRFTI